MTLRKLLLVAILSISMGFLSAQNWIPISADQPQPASVELISSDISTSTIAVELKGFTLNPVVTPRGEAFTVSVEEATPILEKGMPDLPKLTSSLIIPDMANMEVTVVSSSFRDFPGIEIAPSKGNLTRDIDPSKVPFTYSSAYERNEFFPVEAAWLRNPFILRDHRGQTVVINPFAYNPVTKVLRVYYEMTLEVSENGISSYNTFVRNSTSNKLSTDYKQIYERQFLNASSAGSRYTPLEEGGNMLIISYGAFMPDMQDFVDWKTTIGIPVEMVDVATIGANANAIKAYVASYYETNGLTYLLLVGDNAQVPTVTSGDIGGPSDHAYGYLVGNDHYPDIFVGRFSAENNAQVATQVLRSITYEQEPVMTTDWFSKGVGIASDQGPGDDNEYDYQHMRNIRTDLLGFTYTTVAEVYDGSQGGEDLPGNPSPSTVAVELNNGRSIVNYVGHGSQTSWGSSGFSNSDVNALTNNNMWPYIFSVACVNGDFLNGTCFAEAWLRASNANGPTGAVATLMSTINQSWNPPMEGQDEMNDILVESYTDNIKRTFGGLSINGCMKMNDTYGSGGDEMTDTWLIFGDPSLMVRSAMPATLAVTHSDVAFIGSNQFVINSPANGALACLTMNGEILGTAYVTGGTAIINIPTLTDVGVMNLAVTAFNYLPYMAEIEIVPLNGPYVTFNNCTINDAAANNNQQLDYGEAVTLALGLKNAGTEDAVNVTVTIQCTDPYVTLNDTTELYPLIAAGQTVSIPDGFAIAVTNDIPEGHQITFDYIATCDTNSWDGSFTLTAHSVVLNYAGITINDDGGNDNGRVDAGETVLLNLSILNAGLAPAVDVEGFITSADPYVLINVDSVYYGSINGYETIQAAFTVTALPTTPTGYQVILDFDMTSDGGFTGTGAPSFVVGQIPVLIIDIDGNHNSGPAIRTSLTNIGITADYVTNWPLVIGPYQSVFVCLGTYPSNTVLTNGQGQALANFMNNNHGKVYMEGADTWAYNDPTPAHPMFKIAGESDGSGDITYLNGVEGTFTEGMTFTFYGDNSYIDHILPLETATVVLTNAPTIYNTVIAYDGGIYRTIGASCEFGSINSTTGSPKDSLMAAYIDFMGISNSGTLLANFIASSQLVCESEEVIFTDYSAGNITSWNWTFPGGMPETSTEQNPVVTYRQEGIYDVTLEISDGVNSYTTTKQAYMSVDNCTSAGNLRINDLTLYPNPANNHFTLLLPELKGTAQVDVISSAGVMVAAGQVTGTTYDMSVEQLPAGIYFVRVSNNDFISTIKLVVSK